MNSFTNKVSSYLISLSLVFACLQVSSQSYAAGPLSWEKLDKTLKTQVYQINVGLKMKVRDNLNVSLSDLSPKYRFPVFSVSSQDPGYRVVGFGTAFPARAKLKDKSFLVTNRHVADSADEIVKECQRFYAAMRLYAEQTVMGGDLEGRLRELLKIVNISTKKDRTSTELTNYQATVNAIWDTYEAHLSVRKDPERKLFNRYLSAMQVSHEIGYFLHPAGPVTQQPYSGRIYKIARTTSEPDLAILTIDKVKLPALELDNQPACEGQEVQVIGYPEASELLDSDASKYFAPTFSTGRISRVGPRTIQVDAAMTNGNSGAPVVNQRGKVVGVAVRRARNATGQELTNFGGAVSAEALRSFAPELF
jgi:S1-C subfamily serine protease